MCFGAPSTPVEPDKFGRKPWKTEDKEAKRQKKRQRKPDDGAPGAASVDALWELWRVWKREMKREHKVALR